MVCSAKVLVCSSVRNGFCWFKVFFLCVEEQKVLFIAIQCFDVLDSYCSQKVASKVEKCCVRDIQAFFFFVVGSWISYVWSKSATKNDGSWS